MSSSRVIFKAGRKIFAGPGSIWKFRTFCSDVFLSEMLWFCEPKLVENRFWSLFFRCLTPHFL